MEDNTKGSYKLQHSSSGSMSEEIDLRDLVESIWEKRWFVVGSTVIASVVSLIFSLSIVETYRAEATLAPADSSDEGSGLAAQFGGAAALLGVNIGGGGDEVSNAIATLRSRQFIGRFVAENNLLLPLFASKWVRAQEVSEIDSSVFNSETGEWLLDDGAPTTQDAYRRIMEILSVEGPDIESGIVTVSITWHNPVDAADWINKLVSALNQEVRSRDINEANSAVDYLRRQLEVTQLVDMQRVFYQLIESQTRIAMLANVRDEYVFRVIDPAVVPDRKTAPRRFFITIGGAIAGGFLAVLITFFRRVFLVPRV